MRITALCVLAVTAMVALSAAPASGATAPTRSCGFVAFTPNSGDGVFDIAPATSRCTTARAKLRAARGARRRCAAGAAG